MPCLKKTWAFTSSSLSSVQRFPVMGVPVKLVYKSCCLVPYELSWSRIARQQWIVMQKNIQNGKVLLFRIWVVPKFVGPRVLPNRLNTRKSGHACAVLSCGGVYVYELAASACARIYISVIELTAFGTRHWVASHRIASSASDTYTLLLKLLMTDACRVISRDAIATLAVHHVSSYTIQVTKRR